MDDLSRAVRSVPRLWKAWHVVRANGQQSASSDTRKAIARFDEEAARHLSRIARQLREERFRFSKAIGVPIKRPGKQPRPLVISSVQDRVVQRRILDILQAQGELAEFLLTPTSFGGIKTRGVRQAIMATIREIQSGKCHYLRSDIANFFSNIPKAIPLGVLDERLPPDSRFRTLLREAVEVELSNLAELGSLASLFPLSDVGVAQGSCLSVLMGNILLREFDRQMNDRGIACLRYVDDFILLGPSQAHVVKAFESASQMLSQLGLTAYDPRGSSEKAEMGMIQSGFTFLGCRIVPGLIRPSDRAQRKLLQTVDEILRDGTRRLSSAGRAGFDRKYSISNTLCHLGNVLEGWREQYSFCNDGAAFAHLAEKVASCIRAYSTAVKRTNASLDEPGRFRALGISLLVDRRHQPIEWAQRLHETA